MRSLPGHFLKLCLPCWGFKFYIKVVFKRFRGVDKDFNFCAVPVASGSDGWFAFSFAGTFVSSCNNSTCSVMFRYCRFSNFIKRFSGVLKKHTFCIVSVHFG